MFDHVYSTTYLDVQVARASAALPAAGAYDAAPTELYCPGFENVLLSFEYTRGGAAGAFGFKVETSPVSSGDVWHQVTLCSSPAVVPGADAASAFQRESTIYTATGAAIEKFVFGPVKLGGAVERIRVSCHETGNVGAPGTVKVTANFA